MIAHSILATYGRPAVLAAPRSGAAGGDGGGRPGSTTQDEGGDGAPKVRRLLLIGSAEQREASQQRLRDVDATVDPIDWHDDVESHLSPEVVGIILAGAPPTAEPVRHVRTLGEMVTSHHEAFSEADRGNPPPLVVLFEGEMLDARARELYAQGVALVAPLSLPVGDATVPSSDAFHGLLPRTLAAVLAGSRSESVDEALQRQARIRLALAAPQYTRLAVRVEDGLAHARGDLRVLSRRAHVERVLLATPGIEDAVLEDVRVSSRRSDDTIDERIEAVVAEAVTDPHTVSWSVDHGRVVFAGTVASREVLEHLVTQTRELLGVRKIENDLVIDPRGCSEDARIAQNVRRQLDELGVDASVDASVVGSHAVLRGKVRDDGRRNLITTAVGKVPGVDHVVDELRTPA